MVEPKPKDVWTRRSGGRPARVVVVAVVGSYVLYTPLSDRTGPVLPGLIKWFTQVFTPEAKPQEATVPAPPPPPLKFIWGYRCPFCGMIFQSSNRIIVPARAGAGLRVTADFTIGRAFPETRLERTENGEALPLAVVMMTNTHECSGIGTDEPQANPVRVQATEPRIPQETKIKEADVEYVDIARVLVPDSAVADRYSPDAVRVLVRRAIDMAQAQAPRDTDGNLAIAKKLRADVDALQERLNESDLHSEINAYLSAFGEIASLARELREEVPTNARRLEQIEQIRKIIFAVTLDHDRTLPTSA